MSTEYINNNQLLSVRCSVGHIYELKFKKAAKQGCSFCNPFKDRQVMLRRAEYITKEIVQIRGVAPSENKRKFASSRIVSIRERLGITQKHFAELLGTSVVGLRNWEKGRPILPEISGLLREAYHSPRLFFEIASRTNIEP